MGRWLALAEVIAGSLREPGFGAAASVAAAWQARVDPMATRSLVTAAVVLAGTDAVPALYEPLPPCPDDRTLLEWGENLESHIADLLKRCTSAGVAARGERHAAIQAGREAASAARQAPPGGELDDARLRERAAAQVTADCEACLDLLGQADGALRCALDCARALPADLEEAYEAALRVVAGGGVLPFSGDYIAPGQRLEAAGITESSTPGNDLERRQR